MARTISANLQTHLAQECTTLATCWQIKRRDGKKFFFTDHDQNITFENDLYSASEGYDRTAISSSVNYDTDEMNLTGFFSSSSLLELDVRNGMFDFSEVTIFIVNYNDLTQGKMILKRGHIGEILITANGIFTCELRGLTQKMSQKVLDKYQAECRADLGDSKCKLPVDPDIVVRDKAYSLGEFIKVKTGNGSKVQYDLTIADWDFATLGGWTVNSGGVQLVTTNGDISAYTGTYFLESNSVTGTEFSIYQDLDLTLEGSFDALAADAGELVLDASVARATAADAVQRDAGRFRIVAMDANNINLGELWNTDYTVPLVRDWVIQVASDRILPVGTRKLRLWCEGLFNTGLVINAAFDAIKVRLTDTNGASGAYEMYENRIYECTTAGTTASTEPVYDTTLTNTTTDGTAVFTAYESWTRHAVVATVTDNQTFNITVTDSRASDGKFNYGILYFENGNNAGLSMDIKDWSRTASDEVTLFLSMPNDVTVGDRITIQWGCDKTLTTCRARFPMIGSINFPTGNHYNFRGEPYLPGRDQVFKYPDAK